MVAVLKIGLLEQARHVLERAQRAHEVGEGALDFANEALALAQASIDRGTRGEAEQAYRQGTLGESESAYRIRTDAENLIAELNGAAYVKVGSRWVRREGKVGNSGALVMTRPNPVPRFSGLDNLLRRKEWKGAKVEPGKYKGQVRVVHPSGCVATLWVDDEAREEGEREEENKREQERKARREQERAEEERRYQEAQRIKPLTEARNAVKTAKANVNINQDAVDAARRHMEQCERPLAQWKVALAKCEEELARVAAAAFGEKP